MKMKFKLSQNILENILYETHFVKSSELRFPWQSQSTGLIVLSNKIYFILNISQNTL